MGIYEKKLREYDVQKEVLEAVKESKHIHDKLNAVVTFCDVESQLNSLKDKNKDAFFYGVPVVLKDNVCTKGIRTTGSSQILDNYIPIYNAHIVDKLAEQGAIFVAKSSMDELGMGGTNLTAHTGPVLNPYDLNRISGGSSGGSAVLVASGAVPFAIGTDTGDSVRKPAAFNGIVGVKPTYGRISRYGVIPYASSLDHVGYFTRNITDAAYALEVLAGRDDRDMTSSTLPVEAYHTYLKGELKGKRIAILSNVMDAVSNQTVKQLFDNLMNQLREKGAIVEFVSLKEELMKTLLPIYYIVANCEATANHSNLDGLRFGVQEEGKTMEEVMIHSRTKGLSSFIRKRFVIGSYALSEENQERLLKKAQRVRRCVVENLKTVLENYDVIVAVASANPAPKVDSTNDLDALSNEYLIAENYMVLGNFSGYPSLTMPLGYDQGLPIGINLTAKAFDEGNLFDIAYGIEQVTGLKDQIKKVD